MKRREWGVEIPDPKKPGARKVRPCDTPGQAAEMLARLPKKHRPSSRIVRLVGGQWVPDSRPDDHRHPLPGPVVLRCGGHNDPELLNGLIAGSGPR